MSSSGCETPVQEIRPAQLITDEAEKDLALGLPIDLKQTMRIAEMALVRAAIGQAKGNISLAARNLGLNRTTLHEKMRRYGIS